MTKELDHANTLEEIDIARLESDVTGGFWTFVETVLGGLVLGGISLSGSTGYKNGRGDREIRHMRRV